MGFTLRQPLARYLGAVSGCNPGADRPATGLRFCSAERDSVPVTLGFLRDSLVQVSYSSVKRGVSGNASDLWSRQKGSLATAFGRPADSVAVKPARGSIVGAGSDPRGSSAQALTAIWRSGPTAPWCAKVFLTDEATPTGEPLTRMVVDIFALIGASRTCPVVPTRNDKAAGP
jgi:hypothetical protein